MVIPFFLFRPNHPPSGASTGNRIGETKVEKERESEWRRKEMEEMGACG